MLAQSVNFVTVISLAAGAEESRLMPLCTMTTFPIAIDVPLAAPESATASVSEKRSRDSAARSWARTWIAMGAADAEGGGRWNRPEPGYAGRVENNGDDQQV